jgi:hypothetical protein
VEWRNALGSLRPTPVSAVMAAPGQGLPCRSNRSGRTYRYGLNTYAGAVVF